MTEGRKLSAVCGDSTVLRTIVSGGFRALNPEMCTMGKREGERESGRMERGREGGNRKGRGGGGGGLEVENKGGKVGRKEG